MFKTYWIFSLIMMFKIFYLVWNAMGVTVNKPYFASPVNPERKVFCLFDAPHVLKLCRLVTTLGLHREALIGEVHYRNHLCDDGFLLEDKVTMVTKAELEALHVKANSREFRLNWKIRSDHLYCTGSQRDDN